MATGILGTRHDSLQWHSVTDVFAKEKRSEIMSRIRSKNTGLEAEAGRMLREHRIRYRSHPRMYGSPDFLVEERLALFCDSSFWHGRSWKKLRQKLLAGDNSDYWIAHIASNRKRDRKVNRVLKANEQPFLRLWDTDVKKRPKWCANRIMKALEQARF